MLTFFQIFIEVPTFVIASFLRNLTCTNLFDRVCRILDRYFIDLLPDF